MHSCFTSFIFAVRTLDFTVKFRFVFRYEAVVFRRYVLALLSVGLLRKFEAYPVYTSLIRSKNPRRFSFFQKFRHFTYMLLWFHLVILSFPARIDDMRSRFSALSDQATWRPKVIPLTFPYQQAFRYVRVAKWPLKYIMNSTLIFPGAITEIRLVLGQFLKRCDVFVE